MKKIIFLFVCLFVFQSTASAFPWKYLGRIAVSAGAAGFMARGLHHCRQGDVEQCLGHYGQAWVIYGAQTGGSLLGAAVLAPKCEKSTGSKWCEAFWIAPTTTQFVEGFTQYHDYKPEKDNRDMRPDFGWKKP